MIQYKICLLLTIEIALSSDLLLLKCQNKQYECLPTIAGLGGGQEGPSLKSRDGGKSIKISKLPLRERLKFITPLAVRVT